MFHDVRSAHEIRRNLRPAPGPLALVQAFANSVNSKGHDELASPEALSDWMVARGLLHADVELSDDDVGRTRRVRDGLRAVIGARKKAASQAAREALERELQPVLMRARFPTTGGLHLDPAVDGLDGAFGRLLVIIATAQGSGHFSRLGVCAEESCHTVFYDRSTNRRGVWCRARCGNRVHALHHRRREKRRKSQADRIYR